MSAVGPVPENVNENRLTDLVVRTRFMPPVLRRHILARPRVDALIAGSLDYPVTIIKAEPGYGKTTAVVSWLNRTAQSHVWYNVGETESDPRTFLLHLIEALRVQHPAIGQRALGYLAQTDQAPRLWDSVVDALSNDLLDHVRDHTLFVLDDFDRIVSAEVNAIVARLVETMPPSLHVVITARRMPSFRSRARWRASGEMLEIGRSELAFSSDEVAALLERRLSRAPTREVAAAVTAETEGWAIALQMLSDTLGQWGDSALDSLLERIPGPSELLFDYLAEEVFARQPATIRTFLAESALLRRIDPETCTDVLGTRDTEAILRLLEDSSLFVTTAGGFRYHNLFRDFLARRGGISAERRTQIHRAAAQYLRSKGDAEEAVHHMLAAGDFDAAGQEMVRLAAPMSNTGRHQTFRAWLEKLPQSVLADSAELMLARAETARIACQYAEALPAYVSARARFRELGDRNGEQRTLRAHVSCYLDTVQPLGAAPLLREALRLTRGDRVARTQAYLQLAENSLNAGELRRAERRFRTVNCALGVEANPDINPRVYVRQGRFGEALRIIESGHQRERDHVNNARPHRSHRELSAMRAWTDIMIGDATNARHHAVESIETGQALGSPVVECIAVARAGLSWLTGHDQDVPRASEYLANAGRMAERIGVLRFKVEPLLGQTIVHGLEGRADLAEATGREALLILRESGDLYVRGIVCVALGAALVQSNGLLAESWLSEAEQLATRCGDRFVMCASALWLAIHSARGGEVAASRQHFVRALERARDGGYTFLFTDRPLLGPRDPSLLRPLLRRAQEHPSLGEFARELLLRIDSGDASSNAGSHDAPAVSPLFVQTLGPFRVWRDGQEIERSAWTREKSVQLLQLLLTHRARALHRDEILEALWEGSNSPAATTGLRVALSALRSTLEPERTTGTMSRFVERDGDMIRLAPGCVRLDGDEFTRLLRIARQSESDDLHEAASRYERALSLYRGEYLADSRYATWAEEERAERRREFLINAERLALLLLRLANYERASRWAETMLQHDALWEAAYAVLIEAYWRQGNRSLAVRAYNRCERRFRDGLGIEPSQRTRSLLNDLSRSDSSQAKTNADPAG